ncbi:serine/threonine-protein kinase dst4-like [Glandiceps talaboti]
MIARKLKNATCENIVKAHGVCYGHQMGTTIVLELVQGKDLHRLLYLERCSMTFTEKLALLIGVSNGVAALHDYRIVHNDIKLDNVLVKIPEMIAKITDFSFSTRLEVPEFCDDGALEYSSPERFKDPPAVTDTPRDVWALGCGMA